MSGGEAGSGPKPSPAVLSRAPLRSRSEQKSGRARDGKQTLSCQAPGNWAAEPAAGPGQGCGGLGGGAETGVQERFLSKGGMGRSCRPSAYPGCEGPSTGVFLDSALYFHGAWAGAGQPHPGQTRAKVGDPEVAKVPGQASGPWRWVRAALAALLQSLSTPAPPPGLPPHLTPQGSGTRGRRSASRGRCEETEAQGGSRLPRPQRPLRLRPVGLPWSCAAPGGGGNRGRGQPRGAARRLGPGPSRPTALAPSAPHADVLPSAPTLKTV